jgi:hypothetical protein
MMKSFIEMGKWRRSTWAQINHLREREKEGENGLTVNSKETMSASFGR